MNPVVHPRSEPDIRPYDPKPKGRHLICTHLSLVVLRSAYYGPALTQDGHLHE